MTVCNMSIECGARGGMNAPDERTIDDLRGRPRVPQGEAFERAAARWLQLRSDPDARFDREYRFDAARIAPMITCGTDPGTGIPIDGEIPSGTDARPPRPADAGTTGRLRLRRQLHERKAL